VSFELQWTKAAIKDLEHLPDRIIAKVTKAVDELANAPRPRSGKKLIGTSETYRIRVGTYRVVYEIHKKAVVVLIVRVRHRKDVYEP